MKNQKSDPRNLSSRDSKDINLEKHMKFIKNSSIFRRSKDSLGLFQMDGEFKENILDGEDCSSKFEQTQFLENASSRTWKKVPQSNRASLLLSKHFESQDQFSEKAIQLVRVSTDGNFEVTPEGLAFLKQIEGPIVVLGVAGMYRTGKSYLLNKVILKSKKGFGVAPTINACTKGIWIFGKPFRVKLEDGRMANLIVLDSEGLGALDQDSGHDCRIFALVLLLSSMFLYNSVGTIDENAISSLSLVINLTRHIKVKQKTYLDNESDDEEDPEELAKFFPSFLWVLRDFSLELVNSLGEDITPLQYLENSLAAHKGISDEVERKNRVRRMIKQFFPERNCFPLVRPLVNEDDLQRLNELPMEKLRPEFVSQSLHLRELLFSKSRPKKMHNNEINGQVLAGLAQEYVRAINGGAVPNIESAWTYVCSAQREKLRMELINAFEEELEDEILNKLPLEEEKLELIIKEKKSKFKKKFEKESLDGVDDDENRRLKEGIREKENRIKRQNREAMEDLVERVMNEGFRDMVEQPLEEFHQEKTRLKNEEMERNQNMSRGVLDHNESSEWVERETKTWAKMQTCLAHFQEKMETSLSPFTPLKQKMLYSFIMKKILKNGKDKYQELVKCLRLSMLNKESKIGLLIEKAKGCEEVLSKVKKTSKQRIEDLEETVDCLELEREGLERKIEVQAKELKNEMKEKERRFEDESREMREQMQKMEEKERKDREKQRESMEKLKKEVSEWETKQMLFEQKIEFLEKEKKEWSQERGRLSKQIRELEEQMEVDADQMRSNFENELKNLRQEHKQTKDQFREYKEEVTQQSILQESMCRQMGNKEEGLMQQLERIKKELKEAKASENEVFGKFRGVTKELEELKMQTQMEKEERGKNNGQVMQLKKELGVQKKNREKDEALWNQKMDFLTEERDDLKSQLQDLRKVHEKVLSTIQMQRERSHEEKKDYMDEEMKKEMERKISELEQAGISSEIRFKDEMRETQKQKEELLEETDKLREELAKMEQELESEKEKTESLNERIGRMGEQQKRIVKDTEGLWKDKVKRAESEAELERGNRNELLRKEREEMEKRMQEMREFFEEKQKCMEDKWKMEREAGERKRRELNEEWQERMDNGKVELEEEIEELEMKVKEYEDVGVYWKDRAEKMEKEVEARIQREKREKEKIGGEMKARLGMEMQKVENLERELEKERGDKKGHFEGLKKELLSKNAELGEIRQRMELLTEKVERERAERDVKEKKLREDLQGSSERMNQVKGDNIRLSQELIQMRVDFGKEKALNQQNIEFKDKKIIELEDKLETLTERQQQELQRIKGSYGSKMTEIKKSHKEDLLELEDRLEQKRKALKEVELNNQTKVLILEKENTKLQEQVRGMEEKLEEYSETKGKQSEEAERKLIEIKEIAKKKRNALEEELDKQREKAYEAEIALTETLARLDKEEALWKGKFEFLKQQRNQLKLDLSESQKNFDMMVSKLQEYRTEADSEREESLSKQIEEMGHRHQMELTDMRNKHHIRENEYADRVTFLENEVSRLERLNQQTVNKRFGSRLSEEKKLNELLEKEKLLQDEVMMLKCEKDSIGLVYQREMEKEREHWKLKMFEMECSIKKAENERNLLVFEHEKQRTKWMIERDNWVFHKQEHVECIEKLQRQKDHLTKENERLKGNIKVLKKSNLGHSIMSFAKSRYINTPKKI